jgi:uncharacterized membrane protein
VFWLSATLSGLGGALVVLSLVALLIGVVIRHIGEGAVGDNSSENTIIVATLSFGLLAFVALPSLATGQAKQARMFACYFAIAFSFLAALILISIRYFVSFGGS